MSEIIKSMFNFFYFVKIQKNYKVRAIKTILGPKKTSQYNFVRTYIKCIIAYWYYRTTNYTNHDIFLVQNMML